MRSGVDINRHTSPGNDKSANTNFCYQWSKFKAIGIFFRNLENDWDIDILK
jgi:hypothetical protein